MHYSWRAASCSIRSADLQVRSIAMILTVQRQVRDHIADAVRRTFGVSDVPAFAVEVPPNRALGDLAVTVAFQLARTLRKAPSEIEQELAPAAARMPGVAREIVE